MHYDANAPRYFLVGFGFLAVAIFNLQHIVYYFAAFSSFPELNDLSTRYLILSELVEAAVIASFAFKAPAMKVGRWKGLVAAVLFSCAVSFAVYAFPKWIQNLLISKSGLPVKELLGFITVSLLVASLVRIALHTEMVTDKNKNYFFLGLQLLVFANLCTILQESPFRCIKVLSHILRAVSYYYLLWGWLGIRADCTHQKIEKFNERIRKLLDNLPIAMISFSSSGKLYFANKHAIELLACGSDELVGLSIRQFIEKFGVSLLGLSRESGEVVVKFNEGFDNHLTEITSLHGALIRVRSDCYRLENGEYTFIFYDTNKEQEIEHLRLQTKSVLDSTSNFVLITDKQSKIVLCNKAYADLIGEMEEEIIGMNIHVLSEKLQVKIENFPHTQKPILDTKKNNNIISIMTSNGTRKKLLINSSNIYSLDGETIGKIFIASDISDIGKEQQRVQQQEKLALLGQMGAAIVHETKNYLATIKGSCQVLSMVAKDDNIRRYAQKIGVAADEINRIVMDFLSLSKPRSLALKEVSLNEVVRSVIDILKFSSLFEGISVEVSLWPEERPIICDESQIRQVILNICQNAIEAMEGVDEPALSISTGIWGNEEGMYLEIADNGKGMDEDQKEMLWTPFYTTKEYGTGLGLSISFNIIQEHGGKIEIDSEVGKGSCFRILLPFKNDPLIKKADTDSG